jgi:hypothetical protein
MAGICAPDGSSMQRAASRAFELPVGIFDELLLGISDGEFLQHALLMVAILWQSSR